MNRLLTFLLTIHVHLTMLALVHLTLSPVLQPQVSWAGSIGIPLIAGVISFVIVQAMRRTLRDCG